MNYVVYYNIFFFTLLECTIFILKNLHKFTHNTVTELPKTVKSS